jgi:arylsulfatase A-like enzyme
MMRITLLIVVGSLGLLFWNSFSQAADLATEGVRPNVLFIALDDLRPELGCYGQGHIHSPHIDALAGGGVVFERAYCQYPVCNASRASIMTGLRPDSTGVYDNGTSFRRKAPEVVALPQHFKDHGYVTQAFGKIFHGAFETAYVGRKFDDPLSWTLGHWYGSPRYYFSPRGIEVAREVYGKKFKKSGAELDGWTEEFVQGLATEAPDVEDHLLYDGEMTGLAIEAIERLRGQPFFLAVGYLKPHLPFVAPKKYWELYDRERIALPEPAAFPQDAPPLAFQAGGELHGQYTNMRERDLSPEQIRELRHGYYACVSFVDAQIGRLLAALDRFQLTDKTIVVLWGDHGWHLGEQGIWGKMTDFELGTRVPLIVRAPGRKARGQGSSSLVELVDVYPSLCDLAGLPAPPHLEGTSFAPILEDVQATTKTAAFSQVIHEKTMGRTIRTDRYRLTLWHPNATPHRLVGTELYDYQQASIEQRNLATQAQYAGLIQRLSQQLEAGWQAAQRP